MLAFSRLSLHTDPVSSQVQLLNSLSNFARMHAAEFNVLQNFETVRYFDTVKYCEGGPAKGYKMYFRQGQKSLLKAFREYHLRRLSAC